MGERFLTLPFLVILRAVGYNIPSVDDKGLLHMAGQFAPETDILFRHRQDDVQAYMSPEAQQIAPHFHYQYELILTATGTASFYISGKTYHVFPGSILVMSNMENHHILSTSDGYERYIIRFSTEALAALIRDPVLLSIFKQRPHDFCHHYRCTQAELEHYIHMMRLIGKEYRHQPPYWDFQISAKIVDILVNMYRHTPDAFPGHKSHERQGIIFNIQNHIESHLAEDLTLDTLSTMFFMSKYYLSHSFKEITGFSFKQYVIMARMSKAKDMLIHTKESIQKIGDTVGFPNSSHFIRSFRRQEGVSPLQYRSRSQRK